MRTLLVVAVMATSTLLSPLPNRAQSSKLGLGVLIGGSKLQGDIGRTNTGLTGGVMLRYNVVPFFALSSRTTYGRMSSGLDALNTTMLNTAFSANFFFWPRKRFRPFVFLGFSGLYYSARDENNKQLFYPDGSKVGGLEGGFHLGFGLEILTGKGWALSGSWDYTMTNKDDLEAIVEGSNDAFFSGLLGLTYYPWSGRGPSRPVVQEQAAEVTQVTASRRAAAGTKATPRSASNGISFEPGTAKLRPESEAQLMKIFRYLVTNPREELALFSGAADNEASKLALARARAVKDYLVRLGIRPERILITVDTNEPQR